MKKYYPLLVTVLAMFAVGCESMGVSSIDPDVEDIKVVSKTDNKTNLSGYESYSWIAVGAVLNDPEGKWQPPGFKAGEEIKRLVDENMKKKGYTLQGEGGSLGVAFFLGLDMKARKFKTNPETNLKEAHEVSKASLVVVLVDTRTGFVVWMGEASRSADKNAQGENIIEDEKIRKRISYAISEMFSKM